MVWRLEKINLGVQHYVCIVFASYTCCKKKISGQVLNKIWDKRIDSTQELHSGNHFYIFPSTCLGETACDIFISKMCVLVSLGVYHLPKKSLTQAKTFER